MFLRAILVFILFQGLFSQSILKATHFWDCNGMGCDATTLQPWDQSKYLASYGYAPQDPNNHGGAVYGEKLWMVGAASDTLAAELGSNDSCCGRDTSSPGCGKCILVDQNANAKQSTWKVIVMKKNRCPPWSNGCGAGLKHMDMAVPGYDNQQYSTANICNNPKSGFTSQSQSFVCGTWYNSYSDTTGCFSKCASLPAALRAGCELFSLWGWKKGDPTLTYKVVTCPPRFKTYIQSLFGASGVKSVTVPTTYTIPKTITTTTTTTTTSPTTSTKVQITFQNCNNYWVQYEVSSSLGVPISSTVQYSGGTIRMTKASWSQYAFATSPPSMIKTSETVKITVVTPSKTFIVTTKWLDWSSATQNVAVLETEDETQEYEKDTQDYDGEIEEYEN